MYLPSGARLVPYKSLANLYSITSGFSEYTFPACHLQCYVPRKIFRVRGPPSWFSIQLQPRYPHKCRGSLVR